MPTVAEPQPGRLLLLPLIALAVALTAFAPPAEAQQPGPTPTPTPTPAASSAALPAEDLQEMLAPIALYPDTLLANMLAAAIYPDEVAAAAQYARDKGNPDRAASQGWEPSVAALVPVPDALYLLADNAEWTAALGQAYVVQSQDVMRAIQDLRARARANGALQSTEQQTVVESGDTIIIEQPSPQIIYVPSYNPSVVYAEQQPAEGNRLLAGAISFGVGVAVGAALSDVDCDWNGGHVCWGGGWNNDVDVDVDIDRNVNINNTVNRTDVSVNAARGTAGREGTQWSPNPQKVDVEQVKARAASGDLQKYRGASRPDATAAARPAIPKRDPNAPPVSQRAAPAAAGRADNAAKATPAARPAPAKKPAVPQNVPAPEAVGGGKLQKGDLAPSGFSPSPSAARDSDRGAASRGKASSTGRPPPGRAAGGRAR